MEWIDKLSRPNTSHSKIERRIAGNKSFSTSSSSLSSSSDDENHDASDDVRFRDPPPLTPNNNFVELCCTCSDDVDAVVAVDVMDDVGDGFGIDDVVAAVTSLHGVQRTVVLLLLLFELSAGIISL
jgi:hypothetical protein